MYSLLTFTDTVKCPKLFFSFQDSMDRAFWGPRPDTLTSQAEGLMNLSVQMSRRADLSCVRVDGEEVVARAWQQAVVEGSILSCREVTRAHTHMDENTGRNSMFSRNRTIL